MKQQRIRRDWDKVFLKWQQSGLASKEFCKQEKINHDLFKQHQKHRKKKCPPNQALAPPRSTTQKTSNNSFLEVEIPKTALSGFEPKYIRIKTPSGCEVEIPL